MFDAELAAVCGPKGKHDRQRAAVRHGTERGLVTLGGHRVSVEHPRARTVDGLEVPLATYRHFAADDLLTEVVMEPMPAGIGTRCHAAAAEPVVSRSPRGHGDEPAGGLAPVRDPDQDRAGVAALLAADLSPLKIAVLMVDGVHVADHCCVVALGITAAGTKVPVELWEGVTPRTGPWSGTCWPTWPSVGWRPTTGCWWSSAVPRPSHGRCGMCSVIGQRSSAVLSTNDGAPPTSSLTTQDRTHQHNRKRVAGHPRRQGFRRVVGSEVCLT
jgi:hypothetical protein